MLVTIHDSSDPRLAPYHAITDPRALEREGLFVAEGRLVVERLLEEGRFAVHSVAVTAAAADALAKALERRSDVPAYICAPAALRAVTGFDFHRGSLALVRRPTEPLSFDELTRARRVLALEGIANPDNVGGLFRTAFAFGVDRVMIDAATADPFYRKAIRTSMAATLRVPFVRVTSWIEGLVELRGAGFRLVALTPHPDALTLDEYTVRPDERLVLIVGSEGSGLGRSSLEIADARVRIPVDPRADSLNVVTAAAIALYMLRTPFD